MQDNRLAHLLTYTTFHIGVYISLVTALIGAGIFNDDLGDSGLIRYTVLLVFLAGICGGLIGSNIPEYQSYDLYIKAKIGFWSLGIFKPHVWSTLEHKFFWLGVIPLMFLFIFKGANAI